MMHSAERETMPTLVEVRNEQTRLAIYAVLTAYFGATDHEKDRAQEWVNKYENRVSEASDDILDIVTFSDPDGFTDPDMKHMLLIGSILMMATLGADESQFSSTIAEDARQRLEETSTARGAEPVLD